MRNSLGAIGLLAILSACSPEPGTDSDDGAKVSPRPAEAPARAAVAAGQPGRVSQYSSLGDCRVITAKPEEAGYSNARCPGIAGFALRLVESDARQNLFVKTPSGDEHSLKLSEAAGSGFSRIGERIEWRGTREGQTFRPDAMVLRYYVVEKEGAGETAYLLPVKLADGPPCVADRIAPGPNQNEQARSVADGAMTCFKR